MSGITAILSGIAFLGAVIIGLGVLMVVSSVSQRGNVRGGLILTVVGVLVLIVFSIMGSGVLTVAPDEVAVVFQTLSGELEAPRFSGTHIIIPVLQTAQIYPISYNTYTQGENESSDTQGAITARTRDGQEVLIEVSVVYRINPEQVNLIHRNWQNRYTAELIVPVLRGFVRDVVSSFRAEDVYSTAREQIQQEIETLMRDRLSAEGLELSDIIVRDVSFSNAEFAQSIEQVQIAERRSLEAAQAAERARIVAQGESDAQVTRAEGQARATILQAEAQAQALRLVSEQIAANPALIQYEYVQNLSDNISLALVPSNSPFLFDFNSLPGAVEGFNAPEVPQSPVPTPEPTPSQ